MTRKTQVGIIGFGYVGKGMYKIFPDALVYDPVFFDKPHTNALKANKWFKQEFGVDDEAVSTRERINDECAMVVICVPTPPLGNRSQYADIQGDVAEVDLSILEKTIKWLKVPLILIKSTVPPGTTDRLNKEHSSIQYTGAGGSSIERKQICFSPEYIGEGKYYVPPKYPDPHNPLKHDFMIIGGRKKDCDEILSYFMIKMGPAKKYYIIDAVEAELVKYMENTWGFQKVMFCNEWYSICQAFGASYIRVRQGLLLDSRVEEMHTAVFPKHRAVGGKCYPKDMMGIIAASEAQGYEPKLLKDIWKANKRLAKLDESNSQK